MTAIYELIGRIVVLVVRLRFGRQIKLAATVAALLAALAAYLLARNEVQEG